MITRRKLLQTISIAGAGYVLTSTGWMLNRAHAQTLLLDPTSQPKYVNSVPTPSRVQSVRPSKAIKSSISETEQFLGLLQRQW